MDSTKVYNFTGYKYLKVHMNVTAGGTFMPGTSDRVLVPANTFVTSAIIMKGDPNLVAGNIKKDVPIFGVIGSKIMLPMAA